MLNFIDEESLIVLNFVKESTKHFDQSHDWNHALRVAQRATKILNRKDVFYLALLHDVCDHKYPESIPREKLTNFINSNLKNYSYIDDMIDKVSYTYHKKNKQEKVSPILEAVRDADKFEALGEEGIKRLEIYSQRIKRQKKDTIQHCFDKLLRLVPEGYITNVTPDFIEAHNKIVDYVNQYVEEKVKYL